MGKKKTYENDIDISELVDGRGIYAIQHIASSKVYIGQSGHIRIRLTGHMRELRKGTHGNSKLQNAYNKHGAGNFKAITLEITDVKNLFERENSWAKEYDSFANGYNLAAMEAHDYNYILDDESIGRNKTYKLSKGDVIEICHLLNEGKSESVIAIIYGVTKNTINNIKIGYTWRNVSSKILVQNKLRKNSIRLTAEKIIELCDLFNSGVSVSGLAERFNIKSNTIYSIISGKNNTSVTENISIQKNSSNTNLRLTEEQIVEICELIKAKVQGREIAKQYNVSPSQISKIKNGKVFTSFTKDLLNIAS